jgi:hypothetical protein
VRVFGVRWRGTSPVDEAGPWSLEEGARIIVNLNAVTRDVPVSFVQESAHALDVGEERFARVPPTGDAAKEAFLHYVATGQVSPSTLTVVVVSPTPNQRIEGFAYHDQPLGVSGSWPIIVVSTRIARSQQAHFILHELGHVIGFEDTTFYDDAPRKNSPYTRCGLSVTTTTFPMDGASIGAKTNLMSYDVDLRQTFFSEGYETIHRKILDCWLRTSGLESSGSPSGTAGP